MAKLPPRDPPDTPPDIPKKDEKKVLVLVPPPPAVETPATRKPPLAVVDEEGTPNARKVKRRTAEYLALRPRMKEKRDRFISEYIRDWDGPTAYIRSGGPATTASKMAWEYLHEPYVQQKISEIIQAMEETNLLDNKTILMGLIKEARFMGIGASHGARVAAWKTLAQIKGMEQTIVKGNINHTVRGGVMVVPVLPGSDEWEQLAAGQQKRLKEDVRT